MYIITKRNIKDYYDGVAGSVGIDKTIVYKRHPKEYDTREHNNVPKCMSYESRVTRENPLYRLNSISSRNSKYRYGYFVIGFCGKLYIGFKIYEKQEQKSEFDRLYSPNEKGYITYSLNEFISIYEDTQKMKYESERDYSLTLYNEIKNINALKINRDYNTPIWSFENETFTVNPILKDFDFFKVFDAFSAFQEIEMFIGGVLGVGEKEVIEVSDKTKIEGHGFDYKWSFRKESTKKK